jgi:hypothetical protein
MADLLAIISHDRAKPVDAAALEQLTSTYESLRGPVPFRETASTEWARVRVVDRPQPATAGVREQGAGWTAWAGPIAEPQAAAATPLERLDGQFALVRLEEDGSTLRVATDPLGMKPLFSAESNGATYVSSSALVLAKQLGATPSRPGLEAFLRTGNQFGRHTPWEGIERLRPAETIAFTPRGRQRSTYWQPTVEADVRRLSFAECADACVEQASAAIAARYREVRPWLDLTGGFDTRLLALLAQRAELGFLANTSGEDANEDVRLARQIAETADWPWTQFRLPGDWDELLPARIEEAVAWGDGHLDALPLSEVMLGHQRKGERESMLLNGGGGEHYRDYPWGQELFAAGRSRTVNFERLIAWRALSPIDLSVFREDPTAPVSANLRAELEQRVEPFSSQPNTFQCDLLYAFKATGHFGAYQSTAGAWVHMELPFYLKSVFSTAISASPRHRNYHRLMREMMRRLNPTIAAIQTETGGPAEPLNLGNLHRFTPYPWRRGRRFASRLRGKVLGSGDANPEATPTDVARGGLIAALRGQGRLDPATMRSGALYDGGALERLLADAASDPAAVDWTTVGRIVTVELALEAADAGLD